MKPIIHLYKLFFILLIFCTHLVYAQEGKSNFNFNISLAHYQDIKDSKANTREVSYNVTPGVELLYQYHLTNQFSIKTGLYYQFVDMQSHIRMDRFQLGEISVPFLFQYNFGETDKNQLSISTGIYTGKFLHFKWLTETKLDWEPLDPYFYKNYSVKNFFMDLHFDIKYQFISKGKRGINIGPFFHFRFHENWMEHYRKNLYYGIQLGIPLNL